MNAKEFSRTYLGRRVRWNVAHDGGYECVVVERTAYTPDDYVQVRLSCGDTYFANPNHLELIEEWDNKPLPLPG